MIVISELPPAPSRGEDPEPFNDKADAHTAALHVMTAEINQAIVEMNQQSQAAVTAASSADSRATAAQVSADAAANAAPAWLPGAVYSPPQITAFTDGHTYRCRAVTSAGQSPSSAPSKWLKLTRGDHFAGGLAGQLLKQTAPGVTGLANPWDLWAIGLDTGTDGALAATFTPQVTALTDHMVLFVRSGAVNTSPSVTFAAGTTAAYPVVKRDGSALLPGDIAGAGHWLILVWDATGTRWTLCNPARGLYGSKLLADAVDPMEAVTKRQAYLRASTLKVEKMSRCMHGANFYLINGMLYASSGNPAAVWNYGRGQGSRNYALVGISGMTRVNIPSGSPVVKFSGNGYSVCAALTAAGELYTWGHNSTGACGLGHTNVTNLPTLSATDVVELYDTHASAGVFVELGRLFIRKSDGRVYATGNNDNGLLGLGDTTNRSSWTLVSAFAANTVKSLWSLGNSAGCTVVQTTDNRIWLTGYNAYGQLGNNTQTNLNVFTDLTTSWGGATNLLQACGGFAHSDSGVVTYGTLILVFDNRVMTCGFGGNGSTGDGTFNSRQVPYTVPGITNPKKVAAAGGGPTAVHLLTQTGEVYAWGYNTYGQLGLGTNTNVNTPTQLPASVSGRCEDLFHNGVDSWSYGYRTTSFFKVRSATGAPELWAAGRNTEGQAGIGTTVDINSVRKVLLPMLDSEGDPVEVSDMAFGYQTAGTYTVVALSAKGKLYVWGDNTNWSAQGGVVPAHILTPQEVSLPFTELVA